MYIDEFGEQKNKGISLIDVCKNSDELELFKTPAIQTILKYKWDTYGRNHHLIGMFFHFFYTFVVITYIV